MDAGLGDILVQSGPDAGRTIRLSRGVVLGRDDSADVALADSEISRRHASLTVAGGQVTLHDLGSSNGTFVNGARLSGPHVLRAGDTIRIGTTTLRFMPALDVQVTRVRRTTPPAPSPPQPATAGGELRIVRGPGAGRTAVVGYRGATIGRAPDCDLQIPDVEVSRRHALVTELDGIATITDLGSSNGTYVHGERLLAPQQLVQKDSIQIGQATIEFTSPALERTAIRPIPLPVTRVRDVVAHPAKLLVAESGNRRWWTLAVVVATTFMCLLDITIVSVALPSISKSLKPSFTSLQWIVDAYTLMLTIGLLTAGALADTFGRKHLLAIGVLIFTVASLLCSVAPGSTALDLARGLQGVGGALMFACAAALIVQEFPAGERSIAFGVYGAVSGLAVAIGPLVGGAIVQTFNWQTIFYVNIPIGIASLVVLRRRVVNLPGPPTKIDWLGLITFTASLSLATLATLRGNDDGWTSTLILGMYAAAVILIVAFIVVERRVAQPMLDISLFRNTTFVGVSAAAIAQSFAVLSLIFFLTTWLQSVLSYSPTQTGLRLLALTAMVLVAAPVAGSLSGKVSPQVILTIGLALAAAGVWTMTDVQGGSSWTAVLLGLCLSGLGIGLVQPSLTSTAVAVVHPSRSGTASAINAICREGGITAGIAVLGILLQHVVRVNVNSALAGTTLAHSARSIADSITVGGTPQLLARTPPSLRSTVDHAAHVSYAAGLREIFVIATVAAFAGALASATLIRKRHLVYDAAASH